VIIRRSAPTRAILVQLRLTQFLELWLKG